MVSVDVLRDYQFQWDFLIGSSTLSALRRKCSLHQASLIADLRNKLVQMSRRQFSPHSETNKYSPDN